MQTVLSLDARARSLVLTIVLGAALVASCAYTLHTLAPAAAAAGGAQVQP